MPNANPSPADNPLSRLQLEVSQCEACPRLRDHCREVARVKRRAYRGQDYWGRPVPGFGDPAARILLVGLAPGAHGANRTGRMFTGDRSGDFLFAALHAAGFANQPTSQHRDDGLQLKDVYITAAARCAPPGNKPLPAEVAACRPFLLRELALLNRVQVVICLGRIALDAYGKARGLRLNFGHGVWNETDPPVLASYHPSQQNTQTGRLTPAMMADIFAAARKRLR